MTSKTYFSDDVFINTKTNGQQIYISSTGLVLELSDSLKKVLYAYTAKYCPFINKQNLVGELYLSYDSKAGYSFTVLY